MGRTDGHVNHATDPLRNRPCYCEKLATRTKLEHAIPEPYPPTRTTCRLGLPEANRAIHAALAKAHHLAVNISVTVCDADGRLVAFQRMDGALAEADLASIGKALASVTSGRPSGDESVVGQRYFPRAATIISEGTPLLR